ncbi:ubiquitin-associated domain-containing protein 2-like isoform X1 [Zootermopsis nevadensis]|uniref:ubiquitin-associated domain-containing protein 2-like isoform X1 n=1 Tax=Zootermopsis nevadensis TaxID=136037 RepID=UPI000B8EE537|nr:ubiquitin-associated domain-containing protein 2-like isoform X1 [Zootermopsis nevadensis]
MAAILSQYSTTGFYKAPVSKGLMGSMFLTCTAMNMPLLAHMRKYLVCKLPDIFKEGEVWRLLTSRITFLDTKDLVCGALLIYYFRIFERRYGSHKFASYLLATCTIATILETAAILVLQQFDIDLHSGGYLPPGPYGLIFPLFVSFFFDVPRVAQTHILGIPVTGKTLTYLLGLQVCSTSIATVISGLCGIVAGLMYRYNILYLRRWFLVPRWMAKLSSMSVGWLLRSGTPQEGAIGATLEIQRAQQLEMLEQQVLLSRARDVRRQQGQGFAETLVGPENYWPNQNGTIFEGFLRNRRHNAVDAEENNIQPSEEQVQTLMEMGFERARVLSALRNANNDIHSATNILLHES